jgi:hypothetical protein
MKNNRGEKLVDRASMGARFLLANMPIEGVTTMRQRLLDSLTTVRQQTNNTLYTSRPSTQIQSRPHFARPRCLPIDTAVAHTITDTYL